MPQYKVEYRERPDGALLKSSYIHARDTLEAEAEVKRAFTAVQANLGAREYQILDADAVIVAAHRSPDEPLVRV